MFAKTTAFTSHGAEIIGGGLSSLLRRWLLMTAISAASAGALAAGAPVRPLITNAIDESNLVSLVGNTHPAMTQENDRGPVDDGLALNHLYLQLKRAPEVQQSVASLIAALHDPSSPQYHQWLSIEQINAYFGHSDQDIQTITDWLSGHGFTVNAVYAANGVIDFSGTAAAVRQAFHTDIRNLSVKGEAHIANASDPQIPAALASIVHGITSIHDFRPRKHAHNRPDYTYINNGAPWLALVPGDIHTIYNLRPIYQAGVTGGGQTIAVLEDSNVYNRMDWVLFRNKFGLTQNFPNGSFWQIHPQPANGVNNPCFDPGVNTDDDEAILDAEWASAVAPEAKIVLASCANTNVNGGIQIALQNLLYDNVKPTLISISFGQSEAENGSSQNAFFSHAYEAAVLQGISVFVAAGDEGAAESDYGTPTAAFGVNVSGLASTVYNVAVGGTDFGDVYLHEVGNYWSGVNGKYFNSALSYIPEIPWNDSCASGLINNFLGYPTTYGASSFCNAVPNNPLLNIVAGGGGASSCAYGTSYIYGVTGGSCRGHSKPDYQQGVQGVPNDGVRDLPDVSLFAADGVWSHYLVFCNSDPKNYGAPCVGAPSKWSGGGGASFAAPMMAGIQALINQATGQRQGNPNYTLYKLAGAEYATPASGRKCDSSLGNLADPSCVFHDITLGDIDVPCSPLMDNHNNVLGEFNCYYSDGQIGVLSRSNNVFLPAYRASPGYDMATGLGSVNAYNLVKNWPGSGLR